MRLSEQLLKDRESGYFRAIDKDLIDKVKQLEGIVEAVAYIGVDTGYGIFQLEPEHIEQARKLLSE